MKKLNILLVFVLAAGAFGCGPTRYLSGLEIGKTSTVDVRNLFGRADKQIMTTEAMEWYYSFIQQPKKENDDGTTRLLELKLIFEGALLGDYEIEIKEIDKSEVRPRKKKRSPRSSPQNKSHRQRRF